MTLQPRCEDVETAEGVAITVTGVAQVRPHPGVFLSYRRLYLLLIVFDHNNVYTSCFKCVTSTEYQKLVPQSEST